MAIVVFKDGGSKVVNEYGFQQYLDDGWVLDPANLKKKPTIDDDLVGLIKKQLIQVAMDENIDGLNMQMKNSAMIEMIMAARSK